MSRQWFAWVSTLALLLAVSSLALAQGGSAKSALTGVVMDTGGGVLPGVSVVVKNSDTGVSIDTVTNNNGAFSVPALDAGTYTVTVSLSGFKTEVIKDAKIVAGSPASLRVTLQVGSLSETIEVKAGTDLIQTQSATVSSTINADQIKNLPLVTRSALNFVTFLPGVDTTTGGPRNSTLSGLPQNTIDITLDGVNVNNNLQKSTDGFFSMVNPNIDAIQEVTVTGAVPGADSAGEGGVQVRFVTRSGTNKYNGTGYEYFRSPKLNTNYYFNAKNGLPKNDVVLHQYGASEGGPLPLPGLKGKAFFFFNYEEFYQPSSATRTRTIFNPQAQAGTFGYNVTTAGVTTVRTVDLLALAAANGQTTTLDPTIVALLAKIRAATGTTGVIAANGTDPNTQRYIFQNSGSDTNHEPTGRVDINLNNHQKLTGTYYWQRPFTSPDILNNQDPAFPGFASFGTQFSYRTVGSVTLRSTLSRNAVNEMLFGWQWSPLEFGTNGNAGMFADQGGYALTLGLVTSASAGNTITPSSRNTTNWNIDDNFNLLKGRHNLSFGGSFTQINDQETNMSTVPQVSFGVDTTNDPANAMFTTANFPGAASSDLTNARSLYGLLTGRVTSISALARLNEQAQYAYLGPSVQRARMNEIGLYAQDAWRIMPTLTANLGLRWELQLPFQPLNDIYSKTTMADLCGVSGIGNGPLGRGCNLFQPGVLTGVKPTYEPYSSGSPGYQTDWNNFAPDLGLAWRPNVKTGWLRKVLGDPDQATIRGGYAIAYNRNGVTEFTGLYGANPGRTVSGNRTAALGNLVPAGESWPLLYSQKDRLGPPPTCSGTATTGCIPVAPNYPVPVTTASSINMFDPNITVSYSKSYTVGLQRSLSKDMAVEVRYVGTRNVNGWTTENWNELVIVENGFLDEFQRAQQNLVANITAGKGNTFAFTGAPGTSPLPIYLAYLTGNSASKAGDPTAYTGANWTNTTFTGRLSLINPSVSGAAGDLGGTGSSALSFRQNAVAAGLPVNFFQLNPDANQANITRSASFTKYDSLQIDLRRRLSRGLLVTANYTYGFKFGSALDSIRKPRTLVESTGNSGEVRHAFKLTADYDVPFGRGKRYGANLDKWLDGALGNWNVNLTGRVQSGNLFTVTGDRLVGMTQDDLQQMFKVRINSDTGLITMLPDDVILNTRRAFSVDPTSPTGYSQLGVPTGQYIAPASSPGCVEINPGDCGEPRNIFVRGPVFARFDLSVKKRLPFAHTRSVDVEYDMINLFNAVNFLPAFNPGSGSTIFNVTAGYTDINTTNDPGGRLGQIVLRINF